MPGFSLPTAVLSSAPQRTPSKAGPVGSYAVARLTGSLPMGGSVSGTPVHALSTPVSIPIAPLQHLSPRRTDLPLDGQLAFRIDEVLTVDECDLVVGIAEGLGFTEAAPGINTPPGMRMNKTCHWVADEQLLGSIMARIHHLLPQELDGQRLHPKLSHRINMYKYDQGDVFNTHTDGDWPGYGLSGDRREMVQWGGAHSKLSMLLYLNGTADGVVGGSTELYGPAGTVQTSQPAKGAALFFHHGCSSSSVLHKGNRVMGSVPKYVARINVLYDEQ